MDAFDRQRLRECVEILQSVRDNCERIAEISYIDSALVSLTCADAVDVRYKLIFDYPKP